MKPPRNPHYLAWIRTLPCIVCGSTGWIEASHTGPHGLGQKSSDYSAIPLCGKHHRSGSDSYHKLGPRRFSQVHNLDIRAIVTRLNLKPQVRLEAGCFVAHLEGERYVLGKISNGFPPSIRRIGRYAGASGWSWDRLLDHELQHAGTRNGRRFVNASTTRSTTRSTVKTACSTATWRRKRRCSKNSSRWSTRLRPKSRPQSHDITRTTQRDQYAPETATTSRFRGSSGTWFQPLHGELAEGPETGYVWGMARSAHRVSG
jgi:hypothetical protein